MHQFIDTIRNLFERNERISAASIGSLMLLAVVLMGLVSLALLNDKATKGYALNMLEEERQELVTDAEITDMLTLRARSMTSIEESSVLGGMYKPAREDVYYVMPISVVAQK